MQSADCAFEESMTIGKHDANITKKSIMDQMKGRKNERT